MFTPRQLHQVQASVKSQGLNEQEFELFTLAEEIRLIHKKTKFYFSLLTQSTLPVSVQNALPSSSNLYVQYTPDIGQVIVGTSQTTAYPIHRWDDAIEDLYDWLAWIKREYGPFEVQKALTKEVDNAVRSTTNPLAHLHPTVQKVAGSRFISGHYSDAIQKACTALEKAVQLKAGLPTTTTGASVMTTAFSKNNALLHVADDPNEQFGFMALYQGAVMALRNHFAHSLTELTDPARSLEWLGFFSALFYKLDEAQPTATPPTL
jgi:uncharacterized protein (TIGR02391 family)